MIKDINGMKINYECRGEGDLVVLLHGWGANITLFENMMNFMSTKYKVLAMDMPGFGLSSEPAEPWCVDDYVSFVVEFLRDYDTKNVILLGHSFGGRVAIKICSLDPKPFEVKKVVLVDSAGVMPKKSGVENSGIMKFAKKVLNSEKANKVAPNAIEKLRKMRGSADYNAASPIMRKTLVNVVNEDLTALMPNMKMPVLLVWGSLDTATPLADAELMEKLMPEAGLAVFEGAGHYSFLEQPDRFNRVLGVFLKI
ncbi:MAG: alpha/beta hydrolase [Clostridia bacterium]|nr:alpha/beta hydrolase [Clostridia bacterium]